MMAYTVAVVIATIAYAIVDKYVSLTYPGELNTVTGIFSDGSSYRNSLIKISSRDDSQLLSCTLGTSRANPCFYEREHKDALIGKKVTASYYVQGFFPSRNRNRLMTLEIDGRELISFQDSTNNYSQQFNVALKVVVFWLLAVFISCFLIHKRLSRRS